MKLAAPVERIRDEKIAHLVPSVVKNVSAPIRMFTFTRIEMFVKRGTVEAAERKCVLWEMRRAPSP